MSKIIYLAKDNDDLISYCTCEEGLITYPLQVDCPWCGCGWLLACISCRKSFTFARGVEVSESWEELAARDLANGGFMTDDDLIKGWVDAMQSMLADVIPGKRYVYFDGFVVPADEMALRLQGLHRSHDLAFVPQVKALSDPSMFNNILANVGYWQTDAR